MDVDNQTSRPMPMVAPEKILGRAEGLYGVTNATEQTIEGAPDG
jgi:hypothetical protein